MTYIVRQLDFKSYPRAPKRACTGLCIQINVKRSDDNYYCSRCAVYFDIYTRNCYCCGQQIRIRRKHTSRRL